MQSISGLSKPKIVASSVPGDHHNPRLTWEKFDKLYGDLLTYCMVEDERVRLETVEVGDQFRGDDGMRPCSFFRYQGWPGESGVTWGMNHIFFW